MPTSHTITDLSSLTALFGTVGEASRRKEVDHLHPIYQQWITASPFAVLATTGPDGLDASPRGDPASLVTLVDAHTLLLPERRGNNRVDSLRNILHDPRVALLFFIPGVGETLRVGGVARITNDPALLQQLAHEGKPPVCVVEVSVETVFFQCARAIARSGLWESPSLDARNTVPTAGAILSALTNAGIDGAAYDRDLPTRLKSTLY
jgi:PPOX class probable FMN-dependent enzyme